MGLFKKVAMLLGLGALSSEKKDRAVIEEAKEFLQPVYKPIPTGKKRTQAVSPTARKKRKQKRRAQRDSRKRNRR